METTDLSRVSVACIKFMVENAAPYLVSAIILFLISDFV